MMYQDIEKREVGRWHENNPNNIIIINKIIINTSLS